MTKLETIISLGDAGNHVKENIMRITISLQWGMGIKKDYILETLKVVSWFRKRVHMILGPVERPKCDR